jgi:ribokinase
MPLRASAAMIGLVAATTAAGSRAISPRAASIRRGASASADASTGVALITIDAGGQNHIVIVAGTNGLLTPERLGPSHGGARARARVLLQLEVPLETVVAAARAGGRAGRP